ncbi:MAG TPA: glutathione S-transferase family protein [Microvirga sp.]|nr:glutathione S-transferase family protein [Microvirga sp.]
MPLSKPLVYHIPVCPFSQRLEILLELKGLRGAVDFRVVDITKPRSPELLAKTRGSTALPVLETERGGIIKESLVILRYLEDRFPEPPVAQADPYRRAVENMLIALEGEFAATGYRFVMNQDGNRRGAFVEAMDAQFARLDSFLRWQAPDGDFLFEQFGLAEVVFTPLFARFWFLDYYEGFEIPESLERVRRWREACLAHPAAQQVSREEVVKLYYDYALGAGNGALVTGRAVSSFVFEPHWSERPWPPRDKWGRPATDVDLGLSSQEDAL